MHARNSNRSSQQPRQSQHGTRHKRSKENFDLQPPPPPGKRAHLLRQSEEVRRIPGGAPEGYRNNPFERDLSSPPRLPTNGPLNGARHQ